LAQACEFSQFVFAIRDTFGGAKGQLEIWFTSLWDFLVSFRLWNAAYLH